MKSKILLLLVLLPFNIIVAQKVKYKDLYPIIAGRQYNDDILLTKLKEYKRLSPEEGNQYYQMGKLYFRRISKFDVLKQLNGAVQVADSGLYYFKRAKEVINEKEVKRKDEYYQDFLKSPDGQTRDKVTIEIVYKDIDYMSSQLRNYKDNIKTIHEHFNLAVDNYYSANEIFTEIYGTYSTFKEMCLLADDEYMAKMLKMDIHFNDAIKNFELYKGDIKKFPIEGYNQDYKLNSIDNYRLHGLTKSNFLNDDIQLWDYGKWHDEILEYIKSEITPLRATIIEDEKALNDKYIQISNTDIPDESDYRIESDVLLLIKKYDPASFLVDIFKYKESKINLINSRILPEQNNDFEITASGYANSIIHGRASIRALNKANRDLSEHLIERHKHFFEQYYDNNLPGFIAAERGIVEPLLNSELSNLKRDFIERKEILGAKRRMAYDSKGNAQIPLFIQDSIDYVAKEGEFVTLDIHTKKAKSYQSGYKIEKGNRRSYICYLENDSVRWIGYPNINKALQSEATTIASIGNGSVAMIYAYENQDRSSGRNVLVEFTNLGKELIQNNIQSDRFPIDIVFTENDNLFTCVYEDFATTGSNELHSVFINKINQEGVIEWEGKIEIAGEVVSLSAFDDGYLLTCNVNSARNENGEIIKAKSENGRNIFVAQFSNKGELKSTYMSSYGQAHFASYLVNNMDQHINILGFEGVRGELPINEQKLLLIWLDEDLELIDNTLSDN